MRVRSIYTKKKWTIFSCFVLLFIRTKYLSTRANLDKLQRKGPEKENFVT